MPPNTPLQQSAAGAADADADVAPVKGNAFDPSYGMNNGPTAPKGRKKPFILDPLLND